MGWVVGVVWDAVWGVCVEYGIDFAPSIRTIIHQGSILQQVMLRREQRFKTSEHEFRWLALLPLASLSPRGTLLGCGTLTQNVLRIKMCQNTRGPMIGWILGLADSAFSDVDKGFSISQLCILWMSAWASCYLPRERTIWLLLHQVSCPAGEEGQLILVLFLKRENKPQELLNISSFMPVG